MSLQFEIPVSMRCTGCNGAGYVSDDPRERYGYFGISIPQTRKCRMCAKYPGWDRKAYESWYLAAPDAGKEKP